MQRQIRFGGRWTKTIGWLIGVNIGIFLLQKFFPALTMLLGLVPGHVLPFRLYTLVTYAFLHGGVGHIFWNMLTLYFFGGDLELFMGRGHFLFLYFGAALTGGLTAALFLHGPMVIIGASGAIYGILVAYALYFPKTEVLIWFVLPIKVWVLVVIWMGITLYFSVFSPTGGNIAHLAHLGGAVFALLYIGRFWRLRPLLAELKYRVKRRRFRVLQ